MSSQQADKTWAAEHPYGETGTYVTDPETTALIAKVYPPDGITSGSETIESRAAILAAAPKMLEALELASETIRNFHDHHYPDCAGGCPDLETVEIINAVIKKARG